MTGRKACLYFALAAAAGCLRCNIYYSAEADGLRRKAAARPWVACIVNT